MIIIGIVVSIITILIIWSVVTAPTMNDSDCIDNSDQHVICAQIDKPCIKTQLWLYYDNCKNCPINKEEK